MTDTHAFSNNVMAQSIFLLSFFFVCLIATDAVLSLSLSLVWPCSLCLWTSIVIQVSLLVCTENNVLTGKFV